MPSPPATGGCSPPAASSHPSRSPPASPPPACPGMPPRLVRGRSPPSRSHSSSRIRSSTVSKVQSRTCVRPALSFRGPALGQVRASMPDEHYVGRRSGSRIGTTTRSRTVLGIRSRRRRRIIASCRQDGAPFSISVFPT